jgi:flagellar basal-body rod modification protein FlgD
MITPTSSNPTATSSTDPALKQLSGNFSTFLNLLTTQLKYQDPLSPMDSTEFTAQLASFATVEQGIQTNKNLESLIGLTQATQVSTGVSYIGRTIEADTNVGALVNGKAEFLYNLPKGAATAVLTIRDDKGAVVLTKQVDKSVGSHKFTWDGKDTTGTQMSDGVYSVSVAAADGTNAKIDSTIHMLGKVDGVVMSEGSVSALVGAVAIPLDKIVSVKDASVAATP